MRRQELQRQKRNALLWYLVGFGLVQLGLAVGVETCLPAVRDPDFDVLEWVVRERRAEAPGRPFFMALGSSRTLYALRAERLNHSGSQDAPLVLNCSLLGAGPMMQQVILRRLLADGHRPARVFLEVMPLSLSIRDGSPIEERWKFTGRFTAAEVAHLWHYYAEPHRLLYPWAFARLAPFDRYQVELHDFVGLDVPPGQGKCDRGRNAYGWVACNEVFSPAEIEQRTRSILDQYASALRQPTPAPGVLRAIRDLTQLCLDQRAAVEFVMPPEGSVFRSCSPAVEESLTNVVRDLAKEFNVPLIDAREWVDDTGFWDGIHVTIQGASQYTERFDREILQPLLKPQLKKTASLAKLGREN